MSNADSTIGQSSGTNGIDPQRIQQLQDLHLPEAVGWWPLAPGWWFLIVALLLLMLVLLRAALYRRRRPKDYDRWLDQINQCYEDWHTHGQQDQYLQRINHLFREQALNLSGRHAIASLTGRDWINYLSNMSAVAPSAQLGHLLTQACYQHAKNFDVQRVHTEILELATGLAHAKPTEHAR